MTGAHSEQAHNDSSATKPMPVYVFQQFPYLPPNMCARLQMKLLMICNILKRSRRISITCVARQLTRFLYGAAWPETRSRTRQVEVSRCGLFVSPAMALHRASNGATARAHFQRVCRWAIRNQFCPQMLANPTLAAFLECT